MIYMKISDEGLWELCLKGDMRAFRELYCRFYALLRNYGIKLLPDKSLVEDCVQDIFIKLIQNHETLSPTVNVKGYLLKTLRHKLYDTIEKNRKMEDLSLYEDTFQTDELFSRISLDTTEADERVKLLMKALTKLSPHQREIIYLYYVNGLIHILASLYKSKLDKEYIDITDEVKQELLKNSVSLSQMKDQPNKLKYVLYRLKVLKLAFSIQNVF